jgi:uncharacterized membrane protein
MTKKLLKNWLIAFVVIFVLTSLWHIVVFGSAYAVHLKDIARYVGASPTPLMAYFILAHIMVAYAFVKYLPAVSGSKEDYLWGGALVGLMTFGFFSVLSHALFAGWTNWLMGMDLAFSILSGAITGWVVGML